MCKKAKCAFLRSNGYCLMHKRECSVLNPDGRCKDGVSRLSSYSHDYQHSFMSRLKIAVDKSGKIGSCLHPDSNRDTGHSVFRACTRKTRYTTFERAREVAVHVEHRENRVLAVYECPFCHGYHLTSQLRRTLRWEGNPAFGLSA